MSDESKAFWSARQLEFERWYAANRMQLYMHLETRLRCAIEDTCRESFMEGFRHADKLFERSKAFRLQRALQDALRDLPEGMHIELHVEQGSGWVELICSRGSRIDIADSTDSDLATSVFAALERAQQQDGAA